MTFAASSFPGQVEFRIGFYGDLFRPRLTQPGAKGTTNPIDDLADISDGELADLSDAVREIVTDSELAEETESTDKGFPGVPGPLATAMRAIDRKFGAAAGILALGELRQVRRYLLDAELKASVDQRVENAMLSAETDLPARIIIGHSLGSVVALEFARQHPECELALLLTLGSPLSLRMVQSRLPTAVGSIPTGVTSWVNVRSPRDPVAVGGDLAPYWPGVLDRNVDNGRRDPHSVTAYLSARETGQAVVTALTNLHCESS